MEPSPDSGAMSRWELFRLLGEPVRLRLLALCEAEELSIGELAELLAEAQPNVSRHVKPLRQAGLLSMRKEGTRVLVRLASGARLDPVVEEALREGRALAEQDGSLARVAEIVRAREHDTRAFFDASATADPTARPSELGAYVALLGALVPNRRLAVDAGTGDGRLLEAVAPVFDRVFAVDRSETQLALARTRCRERGHANVEFVQADLGDAGVGKQLARLGGADAVFLSRVLHHAASPVATLRALSSWLAVGGALVVLDYAAHEDESMRTRAADLWLGFSPKELVRLVGEAGLENPRVVPVPEGLRGDGPDAHLDWQILVARRGSPVADERTTKRTRQERKR